MNKTAKRRAPKRDLQFLMQRAGIGVVELADLSECSRTSIWRWLEGRSMPRNAQLAALAKSLKVSTDEIVEAIAQSRELATASR